MSANSKRIARHFGPCGHGPCPHDANPKMPADRSSSPCPRRAAARLAAACVALLRVLPWCALWFGMAGARADANDAAQAGLEDELRRLVGQAAATLWTEAGPPPRIEITVGRLDPRLKLAPCRRIEPYLPAGTRPLGATRVGLRCQDGAAHWNVSVPVTVRLFARAMVARAPLAAGTVLQAQHLDEAEVDLVATPDPAITRRDALIGRTLGRGLAAGDALRQGDLKLRRWFDAGDTVRVVASGPGFAISTEGQALGPGIEGQSARVRTEGGRIVTGVANASHQVETAP